MFLQNKKFFTLQVLSFLKIIMQISSHMLENNYKFRTPKVETPDPIWH